MARASLDNSNPPANAPARCRATLGFGLLGALLCYLAHPPAALGWLAWIGPVPWLLLARAERLPGRRPYWALWLAGWAFWLAAIQWLRLPHPANYFGGTLIAGYLGLYLPAFVALTRVAVHQVGLPLWLAGAVAWTGLEWLRARLLTGFLMASLAHTQVKYPLVIQIADVAGEYAVTFLIMLVACAIASVLPLKWVDRALMSEPGRPRPRRVLQLIRPLAAGAFAVLAALAYGTSRDFDLAIQNKTVKNFRPSPRLAIIQTNMLADWKGSPERDAEAMREQFDLTLSTVRSSTQPVDLVLWPETMFRQPWFVRDEQNPPPDDAIKESLYTNALTDLRALASESGAALLVGIDRGVVSKADPAADVKVDVVVNNSAVAVDRDGTLIGHYAKNHLLPFGEYMPFVSWLPFLAKFTPITGTALEGTGHVAFKIDGVVYAPNICYDSVLPQLVRRQVVDLTNAGASPDVLVNLTNDAWFWGSSELDMHLASSVFRAVEMRRPMVIAANRGLSAYVTHWGAVVAVTERDRADALVVDVSLAPDATTIYARYGDWLPLACLGFCAVVMTIGLASRRRRQQIAAT
jgi:apolipoprotein N-acyltransferase